MKTRKPVSWHYTKSSYHEDVDSIEYFCTTILYRNYPRYNCLILENQNIYPFNSLHTCILGSISMGSSTIRIHASCPRYLTPSPRRSIIPSKTRKWSATRNADACGEYRTVWSSSRWCVSSSLSGSSFCWTGCLGFRLDDESRLLQFPTSLSSDWSVVSSMDIPIVQQWQRYSALAMTEGNAANYSQGSLQLWLQNGVFGARDET